MLPSPTADPMAAKMKTLRDENAPRLFSMVAWSVLLTLVPLW
jgi:hypothetical protein